MSNREVIDRAFDKQIKKAENALNKAGILMTDEAKSILAQNKKYVTRAVFKGIYKTVTIQPGKLILNFGNNARSKSGFPYAAAVETGRKAGKMPPVSSILEWLTERHRNGTMKTAYFTKQKKGVRFSQGLDYINVKTKNAKKYYTDQQQLGIMAFLIARKIGKTGTKPFPFMQPAYYLGVKKFLELIND